MKLPYKWLKDFVDIGADTVSPKEYMKRMTMSGSMTRPSTIVTAWRSKRAMSGSGVTPPCPTWYGSRLLTTGRDSKIS